MAGPSDSPSTRHKAAHASRTVGGILKAAAAEYGVDRGSRMAAALSYYTLFALVPLLFIATAAAGFIFGDPSVVERIVGTVEELAGQAVADQVAEIIRIAESNAGASLTIGLVLAVFTGSGLFLQVQGVLNVIFHAPEDLDRGLMATIRKRAVGTVAAVILGVLVLTPIAAVSALGWVESFLPEGTPGLGFLVNAGVVVLSFTVLVLVVGFTFQGLTAITIPWRAARRGGVFTATVGLLGASLVGTYLNRFGATGTLGALGGLAVLLFFGYLMWQVYVFGAELTKVYADYLELGDVAPPSRRAPEPPAPAGDAAVEEPSRAPVGAMAALVVGLVIGLLGGRRD